MILALIFAKSTAC